jgi:hypothetical protein
LNLEAGCSGTLILAVEELDGSRAGFEWLVVGWACRLRGGSGEVACAGTLGAGLRNLAGWVRRLREETGQIPIEDPGVVCAAVVVRAQRFQLGELLARNQAQGLKVAAVVAVGRDMLDVGRATCKRDSGWRGWEVCRAELEAMDSRWHMTEDV